MKNTVLTFMLILLVGVVQGQPTLDFTTEQQQLILEHVYGGIPCDRPLLVRQGYILCYDDLNNVPEWVAYHVIPDYRNTPQRVGNFKTFRSDPELATSKNDTKNAHRLLKKVLPGIINVHTNGEKICAFQRVKGGWESYKVAPISKKSEILRNAIQ